MKIMIFGTFDILHKGHLDFFRQAKRKGVAKLASHLELIVVVARDQNVKKIKKHVPKFNEKTRLKNIKKLKIVDNTILGDKSDFFRVIERKKPDVICLGYDQKMKVLELKNKLHRRGLKIKIFRLKAYKPRVYKSSKLKLNM